MCHHHRHALLSLPLSLFLAAHTQTHVLSLAFYIIEVHFLYLAAGRSSYLLSKVHLRHKNCFFLKPRLSFLHFFFSFFFSCLFYFGAKQTIQDIKQQQEDSHLKAFQVDLSSFQSILKFRSSVEQWILDNDLHPSVQLLINNAGILATSYRVTAEGYDQ